MVAALLALGWCGMQGLPLPVMAPLPGLATGVIALGVILSVWAAIVMLRAGIDPRPDRPDAAMVDTGPFRLSRNPIYLGFLCVALGLALRWGDAWGWLAAGACALMLDRLVVAKEEAYLAARFGAAYAAYRGRVRRWI